MYNSKGASLFPLFQMIYIAYGNILTKFKLYHC